MIEKYLKENWIWMLLLTLFIVLMIFVVNFALYLCRSDEQEREDCQKVCGEFVVTSCARKYDIITCDPNIRVQHFPK